MSRAALWCTIVLAGAPSLGAQPRSADQRLATAAAAGASEQVRTRLDRYRDMAENDLRDDSVRLGGAEIVGPSAPTSPGREGWSSCGLDGEVEPVDLHAGNLLAVQVALASRGARAVALVTLGRPGRARQGMIFPESRWVLWEGARLRVSHAPGFEPDAALALGEREALVFSYTRPAARDGEHAVTVTRLSPEGRLLHEPRVVEDTAGWEIDSPAVVFDGGAAVVLGHEGDGEAQARTESLYLLTPRGATAHPPVELTREAGDDTLGRYSADLLAADDGTLVAGWSVPSGPRAGIWVRRGITLTSAGSVPQRIARRARLWNPTITPAGVLFRRTPRSGDPTLAELVFTPWPSGGRRDHTRPQVIGGMWDPIVVWHRGGVIAAGQALFDGEASPALAYGRLPGAGLRVLRAPSMAGLAEAVDVAVAPTRSGAVIAWIEREGRADDGARRRLAVARVCCSRALRDSR